MTEYDLAIIGSGPGGYVAGIRAGQLGLKTILIESENLGGECLNHGCIPSKALIHGADLFQKIKESGKYGIVTGEVKVDLLKLIAWKDRVVKRLTSGVRLLLERNRVEIKMGFARFITSNSLEVKDASGGISRVDSKKIILASGSESIDLQALPIDKSTIITSREALNLSEIPEDLAVIGGGYIGLELGTVFAKLGSRVTIVELTPSLLPGTSADIIEPLARTLRRLKIKSLISSKAIGLEQTAGKKPLLIVENMAGIKQIPVDKVLVTVGRKPRTKSLGIESTKVKLDDRGFIHVDEMLMTSDTSISAIGDITGGPLLAHKASHQGIVAAEAAAGINARFNPLTIPAVVFTDPEIITVGMSKQQAEAAGTSAKEVKFPMAGCGRALTMDSSDGFVKIVFDPNNLKVLGIFAVGPFVSEISGEAALAIQTGATLDDLAHTIHAHPTISEAIMEAAEIGLGKGIHSLPTEK